MSSSSEELPTTARILYRSFTRERTGNVCIVLCLLLFLSYYCLWLTLPSPSSPPSSPPSWLHSRLPIIPPVPLHLFHFLPPLPRLHHLLFILPSNILLPPLSCHQWSSSTSCSSSSSSTRSFLFLLYSFAFFSPFSTTFSSSSFINPPSP